MTSRIQCPSCGCSDLRVYMTRQRARYVQRTRECRHCGRRIVTREMVTAQKTEARAAKSPHMDNPDTE